MTRRIAEIMQVLGRALLLAVAFAVPVPSLAAPPASGDAVRVLYWNIFLGGSGAGEGNLPQLLDQVVELSPDIFFVVETYGAAPAIVERLNSALGKGRYEAVQISPGSGIYKDNLWIFTRYPVVETYPKPEHPDITAFNLGGIRVRMPAGREVNLYDVWLSYDEPWGGDMMEENVRARDAGKAAVHSRWKIVHSEKSGLADVRGVLSTLRRQVSGRAPTIVAGDFNTLPARDWTSRWARCAGHGGQYYTLRTTAQMTNAGFVDAYRVAHPDVCRFPGSTWSPHYDRKVPQRIDFVWLRGKGLAVRGAQVIDQRLARHGPGRFYSDHAALVVDLQVEPGAR
ncbi:endonuclease/exonuclease/phosphatase family protein [Tahibacter amnicola]|uniref:Endonuclease/exonuclease/phosphatase family protein n=1 Tax=Tahibacter amnicola TaxID=2976241 RepID=A0ABY6BD11_9GAMM|nr:endonuclease/exonuclease/phosphatase family protein [Tahibacter amnicola]UXI67926.1 endonuclease/exonuclease/phosphatase family protein [Tahibacter amnicola]